MLKKHLFLSVGLLVLVNGACFGAHDAISEFVSGAGSIEYTFKPNSLVEPAELYGAIKLEKVGGLQFGNQWFIEPTLLEFVFYEKGKSEGRSIDISKGTDFLRDNVGVAQEIQKKYSDKEISLTLRESVKAIVLEISSQRGLDGLSNQGSQVSQSSHEPDQKKKPLLTSSQRNKLLAGAILATAVAAVYYKREAIRKRIDRMRGKKEASEANETEKQ